THYKPHRANMFHVKLILQQEISDRPSGLSIKRVLEGVCIPSQNGRLKPRPSGRGRFPPP
ncbi:MAG: hypothetical protein Q8O31_05145, partial [Rhodocyclaceae bacterium]|nr:hypothetical protein [Rhodocyclaceae bacterium]